MTETNEPKTNETKYLKIPNNWYDNLSISNEEFTLLIFLYRNYMQYKELALCSISLIATYLRYNTATNRNIVKIIKDILISLVNEKKYITGIYDIFYNEISPESIENKDYLFYCKLPVSPRDNYFEILDKDIDAILDEIQGVNLNKFNLIRYFCACRRVTNCEYKFGYLTQSKLKGLVNDSATVQRYNKLLQDDLNLIRYNNSYLTQERHYCTTFIGTWEDEKSFNTNLKAEVERLGLVHTDKIISNKKRSVKQKLNGAEKDKELDVAKQELEAKDRELKELRAAYEALQYQQKLSGESPQNTWGEPPPDIIEHTEKDMEDIQDALIKADEKSAKLTAKKSSLTKHIHPEENDDISSLIDDYVEETDVINPEANLVSKFLGNYSCLYKDYIHKIADGSMPTSLFFNIYCNHKDYSEYLKFRESEVAIDALM